MTHQPSLSSDTVASKAVNLRMGEATRDLIDQAARSQGRSRSEFMISAARRAAEDALLDQTVFVLEPEAFKDFLKRLDQPPQPNEALKRTLQARMPWTSE